MNNQKTALNELQQALRLNETDPMVFNEMGVCHYQQGNYSEAREYLGQGLSLCAGSIGEEHSGQSLTILLNLAHCHRKIR